ncbi:MAG: phospholipase [Muribaculaceae bacterium]|nr:phospholipase [Muribaculaceae bacterium]
MTGALVILAAMILVGFLLYITDVKYFRHHHGSAPEEAPTVENDSENQSTQEEEPEVCCGLHLVCEKTSLQLLTDEVVYYDDEELDRFAEREPESYSPEETEEFRDVLMTLLPQDVAGWAKSITLRKIELPDDVKDELLMLLAEIRAEK